jgi:hypothetical protein
MQIGLTIMSGSRLVVGVHSVIGKPGVGVGLTGFVGTVPGLGVVGVPVVGSGVVVGVVVTSPPLPTTAGLLMAGVLAEDVGIAAVPEVLLAFGWGVLAPLLFFVVAAPLPVVFLALVAVTLSDLFDEEPLLLV